MSLRPAEDGARVSAVDCEADSGAHCVRRSGARYILRVTYRPTSLTMLGSAHSTGRARRGALTAALAGSGLAIHLVVQRLAPAPILVADDELVGLLPFLPWTVWIYLL